MIYLDNAATTFYKPPEIIASVVDTLKNLSVNPGRGGHFMALKGAKAVFSAREKICSAFGVGDSSRVIFTSGCTAAINLAVMGANILGKHVITTALEHNSVLRPLFERKRRGEIALTVINPDKNGLISANDVFAAMRPSTALVATTHVSNVTGAILPVASIGALCRKNNVLYLVDGAQSVGLEKVNLDEMNIDMLAFPAHKGLHAMCGVGVLALSPRVSLLPTIFGGTGSHSDMLTQPRVLPDGFEVGTLSLPAIVALGCAIDLLNRDFNARRETVKRLTNKLYCALKRMPRISVYSPPSSCGGIVSFLVRGMSSEEVATLMSDKYGICLRGGLHCAPLVHRYAGTLSTGMVRASVAFNNTDLEIDAFISALEKTVK